MTSFPPFLLDRANQCLWRASPEGSHDRIVLRPKAFTVLCHLVDRAGQLVTEDELLEAAWPDVFVQPEAVKGRLFEIRSALQDNPKAPRFIETVPRRGYRFIATVERDAPPANAISAAVASEAGFVGRDAELDALLRLADKCLVDGNQLVFVAGEPGIGKSALLRALVSRLGRHTPEWRAGAGYCIEGLAGREPYYPVLTALEALCRGPGGADVIDTLVTHAPTWLVQFPSLLTAEHRRELAQEVVGAGKERMLRELLSALDDLTARSGPMLLCLEDLHWADEATVDLLSAFARRSGRGRVFIVATVRPLELVLENHPLAALKTDLRCRGACSELELDPLPAEAVKRYVTRLDATPTDDAQRLSNLIYKQSEGNPLFMVAALQNLEERALVRQTADGWLPAVPVDKIELVVPETLRQMLRAQVDLLPASTKEVLLVASVSGPSFLPEDVSVAGGIELDEVESVCHELTNRHKLLFVEERPSDAPSRRERYMFNHALYREVLYTLLPSGRRTRLHQAFGEALEQSGGQLQAVAAELAYHFENSRDWLKASRYLRLAADQASERFSPALAVGFLEHSYRLAQHLPADQRPEQELLALERLSEVQLLSYDRRLVSTTMTLADKAATYMRPKLEVRALKGALEYLAGADGARAIAAIERVERLCEDIDDPLERAQARMHCAAWRVCTRGWREDDEVSGEREFETVRRLADPKVSAEVSLDLGLLKLCGAKYDVAVSLATTALEQLAPAGRPNPCATHPQAVAAYLQYTGSVFAGRWGDAQAVAAGVIASFNRNGHHHLAHVMSLRTAWLNLWAQDHAGAARVCDAFETGVGEEMLLTHRRLLNIFSGAAQLGLGNLHAAAAKLDAALKALQQPHAYPSWRSRALLDLSLFDMHLLQGNEAAAAQSLSDLVNGSEATGELTWRAIAHDAQARSAIHRGDHRSAAVQVHAGLALSEHSRLPMAAWQLHRTGADAFEALDPAAAARHREAASLEVGHLAASLPDQHPLREAFLRSPRVQALLS